MGIVKVRKPRNPNPQKRRKNSPKNDDERFEALERKAEEDFKKRLKSGELYKDIEKQEARKQALRNNNSSSSNESNNLVGHQRCQYNERYGAIEISDNAPEEQEIREKRDLWRENFGLVMNTFFESFTLFGQPVEFLTSLDGYLQKLPTCDCMKETHKLRICMLFNQFEATIEYCRIHRPLLRTLILLQVLPSGVKSSKYAIHFSVFEFAMFAKSDGGMSEHAIRKVLNSYNMYKHKSDYKQIPEILFNNHFTRYRKLKQLALEMLGRK